MELQHTPRCLAGCMTPYPLLDLMMTHGYKRIRSQEKLIEMNAPNVILIEMDGALIDSDFALLKIYNELLCKFGFEGNLSEFNELIGLLPFDLLMELSDRYGLRHSLEDLEKYYQQLIGQYYHPQEMPLCSGAADFLNYANEIGLTLGLIATTAGDKLCQTFLKIHHLEKIFTTVVTPDNLNINLSNQPNIYQHALSSLGTDSEAAITIACQNSSVFTSKEAGVYVLWITPHQKEGMHKKYMTVHDWAAIKHLFHSWFS